MAVCLRIAGKHLDVDTLVRSASIEWDDVYRRGEPRNAINRTLNDCSGAMLKVSDAGFHEFETQLEDAQQFVSDCAFELKQLAAFPGVDAIYLDFGTGWVGEACQFWRFPAAFLKQLGDAGVSLELSHYPVRPPDHD